MTKITWKPGTLEYPLPPAMISCGTIEHPNIMTAAWTGIVNSEPPMTYVSIRPSRYSHGIIKESGEFVINLTTEQLVAAADFCGVKSGKDVNKFKEMKLTAGQCSEISAPQIVESPVSLECKVKDISSLGSHDMFLAEIVAVNVDDKYIDATGKLRLEDCNLVAYAHNAYYSLGRCLGFFGFSVCRNAMKINQRMKNVVVEVKTPKIKLEDHKSPQRHKGFKSRRKSSNPMRKKAFSSTGKLARHERKHQSRSK
ncbi:MAG: flavin reductase family protein [Rhodospirillales bacterium]|nr:flavin reductase family protein [Rhodospirillales bacterium]